MDVGQESNSEKFFVFAELAFLADVRRYSYKIQFNIYNLNRTIVMS